MTVKTGEIQRIDLGMDELTKLLDRAKEKLPAEDYQIIEKLVNTLVYLSGLLEKQGTTIKELRKLLFGLKSEKLSAVLDGLEAEKSDPAGDSLGEGKREGQEEAGGGEAPVEEKGEGQEAEETGKKRKGHGRHGADDYHGAEQIEVECEGLTSGDACPDKECTGRVYELPQPKVLVRLRGQAPVGATVIRMQQLRCNLCLKVFTAKVPEGVGPEKYDETAASMIALLRYGTGLPFNRLKGLQANFGIPLPASTQWDLVNSAYQKIAPAYDGLIDEAAQGDVLHNDDTPMKILEFMKKKESDDG